MGESGIFVAASAAIAVVSAASSADAAGIRVSTTHSVSRIDRILFFTQVPPKSVKQDIPSFCWNIMYSIPESHYRFQVLVLLFADKFGRCFNGSCPCKGPVLQKNGVTEVTPFSNAKESVPPAEHGPSRLSRFTETTRSLSAP